ncbi:MAG: outer membrane lipoprotein carrier protein LolA [Saprospiraceae bacterium]|nr:outer membrane lipoprotein carrier protein LolA [Saprospiraceae bacterium]MCF8251836.1 outer membrane lipoprotein carrier protein LolA [Saprospiraceae bacterium]MCF8281955.1 outer membrane lipoprotein carrier protein LolA [Bacteroidales bacterium]MCF8313310.1 outer membrane lipoprotein carrier protein LolA [Saprospiraceae bacterium]MCF8441734.1 outer membrane lipoprotein carrier protein LolA [Saprospiraceae bacterium]
MQKLMLALLLTFVSTTFFAQKPMAAKAEVSDPEAKAVLEKMRKKYEAYGTLEAEFSLDIEMPRQPTQTQKGVLIQQAEKYRLKFNDRTMVSDGKSVWLHIPKNKQVQINDVDEDAGDGGISSPQDLLKAYAWKDYEYAITNEFSENGKVVQQIEFKPTTKSSDYSKVRLTLDKKTLEVVSIKSFGKDGSRYTLTVNKLTLNKTVTASTFTFNKTECLDCKFEDLRVD